MIDRIEAKFPDSYRNGSVLMIHGDCMDVMEEIGEKEIPLAIVDPPYGIERFKHGSLRFDKSEKAKNGIVWDNPPDKIYFDKLFYISINKIIWGANNFVLPKTEYFIVWDKMQTVDNFASAEYAWTNCKQPALVFRYSIQKEMANRKANNGKIHPTQKPVALYKWLLSRYAKHGELILDTHGGSGSIVIACHDLGHPIIWVEKDADYYRDAVSRYKTHASQAVLFEPVEIMKEQKLFEV